MLIAAFTLAVLSSGVVQPPRPTVGDVGWLSGCWAFTRNGRHVIEQWSSVEGGTLIGISRTVAGDRTIEYEFLLIRATANGLEYVAKPSGQDEATFTSTLVSATQVVFENPAHDFPQRILYQRNGSALTAAVEGPGNGQWG